MKDFIKEYDQLNKHRPDHIKESHLFINFLRAKLGLNMIGYDGFDKQPKKKIIKYVLFFLLSSCAEKEIIKDYSHEKNCTDICYPYKATIETETVYDYPRCKCTNKFVE